MAENENTTTDSTSDEKLILKLLNGVSNKYHNQIKLRLEAKKKQKYKKQKLREKFLGKQKDRKIARRQQIRLLLFPAMLSQAIFQGIPLREPKRKEKSREEFTPLLFEVENKFLIKKDLIINQQYVEFSLDILEYVPDKIYLQRIDTDNSKMLVKMYVDWGYLDENLLHLFLNSKKEDIAICQIVVLDEARNLVGVYPLKHISKLIRDRRESANSLFIGQMNNLKPNTIYKYRIECYRKADKKLFAGTKFITFRTSFNLSQKNKPLFLTVSSDLHAGRKGGFMRGKVQRKVIKGNNDLARVFSSIAATERHVTFDEGYSLSIATGDLTENASYSEYWADLFKRCSVLWNHVPLLTSIGNHDYYCGGKRKGQVLGGSEEDCRYWHKYITNPVSKNGCLPGHWYSIDQGNVHAVFLDSNGLGWGKYELECNSEQWHWLLNDLRQWRERVNKGENVPQFCFVFLHSAIMSLGFWGRGFSWGNDEKVQSFLTPLFRKYGVDMVFCGHDHIYQRSNWLGTTYLQNGRYGGSTRPYFFWRKRKIVYDLERVSENWNTRIYTTVYVPPNLQQISPVEENEFEKFKMKVKDELMTQPLASNFFFGLRRINQKIGELFDKNKSKKEELIDKIILTKLDDHVWLRSYAVEDDYNINFQEIFDMKFIKSKIPCEYTEDNYEIVCPEELVD
ncbi:MAG: hypothetical protein GPJ52_00350 [Candidatus Heimdallarchaeota archaeon]|nr:hypothetical protein [Candidatus Heimdallarchaeota archaeon]